MEPQQTGQTGHFSPPPSPTEMEFNRKLQQDMALMQMKGAIIDLKRIKFDALEKMYKTMTDEELNFKCNAKESKAVRDAMKQLMMSMIDVTT